MYRIASIEIHKFRGNSNPLNIPLDSEVNFFIGRNGTGKTTLMNLLNAALAVDMQHLQEAEFSSITFKLKRDGDRKRPYIKVQRSVDDDGDPVIEFVIAKGAKSGISKHSVLLSGPAQFWTRTSHHFAPKAFSHDVWGNIEAIRSDIRELIALSWISVHRSITKSRSRWEEAAADTDQEFESPVDRKLHQVSQDFGAYFSTLDKLAAAETDKFQKLYLLSLISPSKIESISSVNKIDIDEEKAAITGMFSEFNIKTSAYNSKLDNFIKRMSQAIANYKPNTTIDGRDFLVLTDTIRIHDAARNWHNLLDKRRDIYSPKQKFIEIINGLFFKKTIEINAGNQPVFRGQDGREIKAGKLSSGEKQLFILLGETLLQRSSACIFMADEPEISLHIDWQEKLVPSLRKINPNAQIVSATHSPDVVGAYTAHAIDLERVF